MNFEPGDLVAVTRTWGFSWPVVGTRGRVVRLREPLVEVKWNDWDKVSVLFPDEIQLVSVVDLLGELDQSGRV